MLKYLQSLLINSEISQQAQSKEKQILSYVANIKKALEVTENCINSSQMCNKLAWWCIRQKNASRAF